MVPVIIYQGIVLYYAVYMLYMVNTKSMVIHGMRRIRLSHKHTYIYIYDEMLTFIEIDHKLKA